MVCCAVHAQIHRYHVDYVTAVDENGLKNQMGLIL